MGALGDHAVLAGHAVYRHAAGCQLFGNVDQLGLFPGSLIYKVPGIPFDGFLNGLLDGLLNGLLDGLLNGLLHELLNGLLDGFFDGFLNGFLNGLLDGFLNGFFNGLLDGFLDRFLDRFFDRFFDGLFDGLFDGFLFGLGRGGRVLPARVQYRQSTRDHGYRVVIRGQGQGEGAFIEAGLCSESRLVGVIHRDVRKLAGNTDLRVAPLHVAIAGRRPIPDAQGQRQGVVDGQAVHAFDVDGHFRLGLDLGANESQVLIFGIEDLGEADLLGPDDISGHGIEDLGVRDQYLGFLGFLPVHHMLDIEGNGLGLRQILGRIVG